MVMVKEEVIDAMHKFKHSAVLTWNNRSSRPSIGRIVPHRGSGANTSMKGSHLEE